MGKTDLGSTSWECWVPTLTKIPSGSSAGSRKETDHWRPHSITTAMTKEPRSLWSASEIVFLAASLISTGDVSIFLHHVCNQNFLYINTVFLSQRWRVLAVVTEPSCLEVMVVVYSRLECTDTRTMP